MPRAWSGGWGDGLHGLSRACVAAASWAPVQAGPASDDHRRTGRAMGGGDDTAQPGRACDGELPAGARDRELQPVPGPGTRVGPLAGCLPLLGSRVLAAAAADG